MRHIVISLLAVAVFGCAPAPTEPDLVVISVVGTNDVHGELVPQPYKGGLTTFSGYVSALRQVREAQGGAVLLVDAGDMWQGTLESNLSEGAPVVEAYNALGYVAAAIGNHEFDFGPAGPKFIPQDDTDDPQGALRQRVTEANFPLLAANLIDADSGDTVDWENVERSVMAETAGVRIGIIGVLTKYTLQTTIAANTTGVRIAPLAETIIAEARKLRRRGADLVVVLAHVGGRCQEFTDPHDLSSCDMDSEIMVVANAIPQGLVDHIVGGHIHQGIAHIVNGITITASYSNTRAFSRADFTLDRRSGKIVDVKVFPPQPLCAYFMPGTTDCAWATESDVRASYEGLPVVPMAEISAIAVRATEVAARYKAEPLGVTLETPITLDGRPESALGNLMVDAVLESNDADISFHNVVGGIRASLPAGELTYGSVYRMMPFDNRVMVVELTGREVRKIVANQVHNYRRRAGFSGMRVFIECDAGDMTITLNTPDGREIADDDVLRVVINDFLALGGDNVITPVIPEGGFDIPYGTPLVRDTLVDWFKARGGTLRADEFLKFDDRRWNLPAPIPADCRFAETQ